MSLTAKELHALAPFGAYVTFSDGTPRPPDRFKNKLRDWKSRNAAGYFMRADPGDPSKSYARPTFTLQTLNDPVLVVNSIRGLDDDGIRYDVKPPATGTILAYSDSAAELGHPLEIRHIWRDLNAARHWEQTCHYDLLKCGYRYLVVKDGGTLADYTPPA